MSHYYKKKRFLSNSRLNQVYQREMHLSSTEYFYLINIKFRIKSLEKY